ncbi:helix-turn-helix transcriptional regulator [Paenibacillus sp. LHD-38]|uniref:helix-turn-helix domain-containing protein n=1 Tax=Paenibacillus sp. LHD-38 TaxID=3072143 RepID=UPI00280F013B|nr:helix-turn-helix transcriptional regulator [Paenibacillus sp. LHD-38]MDQ8734244.1 helix-turn-helix transcriptional regulator [Paenibacillus sp. LHD-38]
MSFGTNLRYFRIRKDYTLQQLAELLDVSANYLSTLENGNGKIKPDFLPRLCNVLQVTMDSLYEENDERKLYK